MPVRELEVPRAAKLNRRLRLVGVDVHGLLAQHLGTVAEPKYAFDLAVIKITFAEIENQIIAVLPLKVEIQHKHGDQTTVLANLEVALRLTYEREGGPLDLTEQDVLPDFLGIVGWAHAWPYARAEVQSMSTKLGFPALVLPVLHAGGTKNVIVERVAANTGQVDDAEAQQPRVDPEQH
jgi:preprotein translocase subunit SecB